jgi:hypothetical protein
LSGNSSVVVERWLISQSRVAAAGAQGQVENPLKGECLPLEAVSRVLITTQQIEKI